MYDDDSVTTAHLSAADSHDDAAALHEQAAEWWGRRGEREIAGMEWWNAEVARDAAQFERGRASRQ